MLSGCSTVASSSPSSSSSSPSSSSSSPSPSSSSSHKYTLVPAPPIHPKYEDQSAVDKLVEEREGEEEGEEEEERFMWKCEFCSFENILRGVDCLEELPQVSFFLSFSSLLFFYCCSFVLFFFCLDAWPKFQCCLRHPCPSFMANISFSHLSLSLSPFFFSPPFQTNTVDYLVQPAPVVDSPSSSSGGVVSSSIVFAVDVSGSMCVSTGFFFFFFFFFFCFDLLSSCQREI